MFKNRLVLVPSREELLPVTSALEPYLKVNKHPFPFSKVRGVEDEFILIQCGAGIASVSFCMGFALQAFNLKDVVLLGIGGASADGPEIGSSVMAKSERFLKMGAVNQDLELDSLFGRFSPFDLPEGSLKCNSSKAQNAGLEVLDFGTCDQVSASEADLSYLRQNFPQVKVENMEGAAVAMACHVYGLDFTEVRFISNKLGDRDLKNWDWDGAKKALESLALSLKEDRL